jgi:ribosomal protein L37AE/L43A
MNGVVPIATNELYIAWSGLQGTHFRLYRSGSPDSGFVVIQNALTVPFYTDMKVDLYDEANKYYYKVEGLDSTNATVATSNVMTASYNKPDGVAVKVVYESRLVLRVMNNPLVHILIKKRVVDHCPDCWNTITKRTKYANCPLCHGTGNIGGYYAPFPVRMSMDVSQLVDAGGPEDSEKVNITPINAWMSNSPLLNPDDVIVDVMNRRYIVQSSIPRTRSQYVIRQILQLVPLEKGHPAYDIHVNSGGG